MKVINRINNNVVLIKDGTQKMIVTGKGLGFEVYPGNDVIEQLIEQRFILQEHTDDVYYIKLLKSLPMETLNVC
ncbi:CAT RNA binding domain-containing protein [[Clostridium] innocuum]|nr:CAT RNA binding domain-containing protein [[Clostridium] innocuum]